MRRRFRQVDVFTDTAYQGNPVAVVLDAEGLTGERMAAFARWTNLSETTFVLPPTHEGADYRVRIFTPGAELPFAGHPTLGTCHAWVQAGGGGAAGRNGSDGRDGSDVVQECGAGLVTVRRDGERLAFAAPPLVRSGPVDEAVVRQVAEVLHLDRGSILDAEWVDNGPGWVAVLLADAAAVLAVRPDFVGEHFVGVVGFHPAGSPEAIEVRAFFPVNGATVEDPVTGSLNASLAPWLARSGRVTLPYTARQGTCLRRSGRVHLSGVVDGSGPLWVGGTAITCVEGFVEL
jgi:PhzF family phenazine biosynthesis protein